MSLASRLLVGLSAGIALACAGPAPAPTPAVRASATPEGLANGSFTATLNGFAIHYEVHGQGPVLMTVPNSWGLSLEGLRAMYRPLEERLTLVYFDPRGMGESAPVREDSDRGMDAVRADFQALREHLGLARVNAIGWSNGAANLIFLAHERPDTLSSAIFLHGVASFTQEDGREVQARHPELMKSYGAFMKAVADPALSIEDKTALQRKLWLEEYFPASSADPALTRARLAEVFEDAQFSWAHAEYTNRTMAVFDARDKLAAIPVRSLVIAGAHDMLPPEKAKPLADGLPNAEFAVFESSGHFAQVEEPEAFRTRVWTFLGVARE